MADSQRDRGRRLLPPIPPAVPLGGCRWVVVPELTRITDINLNARVSLRHRAVTISLADDAGAPLEFCLCGRLDCRGGGLALVPVRLCRTHFQALNERKPDAAAAHSKLVAVNSGVRLRRHCSGRRAGSHWLDCTGAIGILGGERCDWSACFEKRPETALQSSDLHTKSPDQLKCVIAVRPRWKLASGRQ